MIRNFLALFTIFFGLSLFSMGFKTDTFLGAGLGLNFDKQKIDSKSNTENGTLIMIKGGFIIEDYRRLSFIYNPSFSDETNINKIYTAFDYILPLNYSYGTKAFLGVHLGLVNVENKELEGSNPNSLMYGAQFGIINELANNLELETGLVYSKYDIEKDYTKNGTNIRYKLDNSTSLYVSINYKF
ncbi:hypothetical protein [Arcobacter porcinus]|uniref:Outer membrane protein beta-barrel domain-containing protein n=1 Tax=Arcobacter porcinus TaxID=1935204 RepID=A0A5C2HFB0_9BACT|nr:hypothetical protein [Arcobacter porcinus]OCL97379.1 hypothetical protein AAX27_00287 [Aliarcobacter thereius]QEP41613.1 hypothetical protein APORC_2063 [Arcobacter porcinus]